MTKFVEKEKKKRIIYIRYEKTRLLLKSILKNSNVSEILRQKAALNLSLLPKNSSKVRLRNRCFLTGRGRFILSSFNLSRLMLRKLANEGVINHLKKASW